MAIIETWLKTDLQHIIRVQELDGNLFTADNGANRIGVIVTDHGVPATLTGTVTGYLIRSDEGTIVITGQLQGDKAWIDLPAAAYAKNGPFSVVIKNGGTTIGACAGYMRRSSTDEIIDPGTILPTIDSLLTAIDTAVASIPADYSSLWTSLAPAFSTSTSYTAGQYVTYNGKLYRFTTNHTAGSWNSAHAVAINVGSDLNSLKSALDGIGLYYGTPHNGYLLDDGTYTGTSSYHSLTTEKIPCVAGDKFLYKGIGSSNAVSALYYTDDTIIGSVRVRSASAYTEITIPTGCNYVVFSSYESMSNTVTLDVLKKDTLLWMVWNYRDLPDDVDNLKVAVGDYDISAHVGYLKSDGTYSSAGSSEQNYHSVTTRKIPCSPGDIFFYRGKADTAPVSALFYTDNTIIGYSRLFSTDSYITITTPQNCNYVVFSSFAMGTDEAKLSVALTSTPPGNRIDINRIIDRVGIYNKAETNGYLNESGTYNSTSSYHSITSERIRCNPGDIFLYTGLASANAVSALFYADETISSFSHTFSVEKYIEITIPAGCNYVVFSSYEQASNPIVFDVKKKASVTGDIFNIANSPLSSLPDYILGNLAYKPLGELTKPYICLVTDDGRIEMNTYTIPMVLAKGVPMTFAIMSDSEVMWGAERQAVVKNAIENGGCSVAQHGGVNWTEYTEYELNQFFEREKEFFDSIGIEVHGAVIPSHYNSKLVFALAGGRFGVVRSGYGGHFEPTIHYEYYTAGARSNLFALPSYNIKNYTLEENKQAIEYAIENNKLLIIYIHENDLDESDKELFEAVIDYAKTRPIQFITLGDVATIV